jgi:hypothetical protein
MRPNTRVLQSESSAIGYLVVKNAHRRHVLLASCVMRNLVPLLQCETPLRTHTKFHLAPRVRVPALSAQTAFRVHAAGAIPPSAMLSYDHEVTAVRKSA